MRVYAIGIDPDIPPTLSGRRSGRHLVQEAEHLRDVASRAQLDDIEPDDLRILTVRDQAPPEAELVVVPVRRADQLKDVSGELVLHRPDQSVDRARALH